MSDTKKERTVSTPAAGVASERRAMRDNEEERTGSAPVAGVVS